MAAYCVAELRHRAESITPLDPPPTFVYNGDVYKFDNALSPAFRSRFQNAVVAFESKVPEDTTDGLPGSSQAVRNVVDPFLFPLLYGRTHVLPGDTLLTLKDCISRCGDGVVVEIPADLECEDTNRLEPDRDNWYAGAPIPRFSNRFQCLPCEVDISTEFARSDTSFLAHLGRSIHDIHARITSYINNLHPVHERQLYSLVEEILTATIPVWEWTLGPVKLPNWGDPSVGVRIPYDTVDYDFDPPYGADGVPRGCPSMELGEERYTYEDRVSQWLDEARILAVPDVGTFAGPPSHPPRYPLREDFKDRGIQVVVKLTSIHLTPENSVFYHGDSWHPDGMMVGLFVFSAPEISLTIPIEPAHRRYCHLLLLKPEYHQRQNLISPSG